MIKLDLSDLPIAPRQYQTMGIIFMVAGVILLVLGIILGTATANRREAHANRVKVSSQDCSVKIKSLGLTSVVNGDTIRIMEKDLSRGMELLATSSQAASLCVNWKLSNYCLGQACTPPGLSMTLQYGENK